MASASAVDVKTNVLVHIMESCHIERSDADKIYNDTCNLYHNLLTLTDFTSLKWIDDKVLSSLVVMIKGNRQLNDANR